MPSDVAEVLGVYGVYAGLVAGQRIPTETIRQLPPGAWLAICRRCQGRGQLRTDGPHGKEWWLERQEAGE